MKRLASYLYLFALPLTFGCTFIACDNGDDGDDGTGDQTDTGNETDDAENGEATDSNVDNVEDEINEEGGLDALCCTIDVMGLLSLGSFGTCKASISECNHGTQEVMLSSAGALLGDSGAGGLMAQLIGGNCAPEFTCCMNENACESLNSTIGGIGGMIGGVLGSFLGDAGMPEFICQDDPCAGSEEIDPWGCPGGGFCCLAGDFAMPDGGVDISALAGGLGG